MEAWIQKTALGLISALLLSTLPCPASLSAKKSVSQLSDEKDRLQETIDSENEKLVDLLSRIEVLENDIENNRQMIREAEEELEAAEEAAKAQRASMKSRMQYLYENTSNETLLTVFFASESFTDFLNRLRYSRALMDYDRDMIASYESTQDGIQAMQEELLTEKTSLENNEVSLSSAKNELDNLLDQDKAKMKNLSAQLEKAEEEARKKAEEEERRRAAEEARQNALTAYTASDVDKTTGTGGGGGSVYPVTAGGTGEDVIAYARTFVGNPYVWGGNSLTEGCDCSGFVVQIYKHFGVDLSEHRNSALLRDVGQEVAFEEMKAGDVVCYSGHVALYDGAGKIVEAQSSKTGITDYRDVTYKQIITIRRLLP